VDRRRELAPPRPRARAPGEGAIGLLEEATHLLAAAPASAYLRYYLGSIPFILAFLFFWSDMSQNAFAVRRCAGGALAVAAAFAWMKCWQALFSRALLEQVRGVAAEPLGPRQLARLTVVQTFLHATGFIVLPLALLLTIPFGWVYAFYQSLTVEGDGQSGSARLAVKRAARQAARWPAQNHKLLGLLFLLSLLAFLNVLSALRLLPTLLKWLLGIETWFTRSEGAMLNTTVLAAAMGIAYLCLDPLIKAVYCLRCHLGGSIESGEDLLAELRALHRPARLLAAAVLISIGGLSSLSLAAGEVASPPPVKAVEAASPAPASLDRSIDEVLARPEFGWRMPREVREDADEGLLAEWMRDIGKMMKRWWSWIWERLFKTDPSSDAPEGGPGAGWMGVPRALWIAFGVVVAAAAAFVIARALARRRRRTADRPVAAAIPAVPDVRNEDVAASDLPEDGWMRLARELLGKGEARLALRAYYLSSLAGLAGRGLISIARSKSNRDYSRELGRRGHAFPHLVGAFGDNVQIIDRVWYGIHPVTEELVSDFTRNLLRLKGH
jgi:hypothetical protein